MRSYGELKAILDSTEEGGPIGMTAEEIDFLRDEMAKRDVCSEESPDWKAYADYVRKTPLRLMPLFGGPAHGQWVVLPAEVGYELVCGGGNYVVNYGSGLYPENKEMFWWAGCKEINATITYDEVATAYEGLS